MKLEIFFLILGKKNYLILTGFISTKFSLRCTLSLILGLCLLMYFEVLIEQINGLNEEILNQDIPRWNKYMLYMFNRNAFFFHFLENNKWEMNGISCCFLRIYIRFNRNAFFFHVFDGLSIKDVTTLDLEGFAD